MIHARCSPSGADCWSTCTASVPLKEQLLRNGEIKESDLEDEVREQISEEEIIDLSLGQYSDVVLDPTRDATSFSAEGTVMHQVRADCLFFDEDPQDYVGKTLSADGYSFTIDEEMADRLVAGIDWIREHTDSPTIETRVPLEDWLPGNHGFCDTFWVTGDTLFVSDYKNGVGEPIQAINNKQLRLYALGAWLKLGKPAIRKVILNIDQPRAGGMKVWEITFAELLEFGEEMRRVYERIQAGKVEFAPSQKGCRFCPVRKTARGCAAFNQWNLRMLGKAVMDISNDPVFDNPAQMSRAQRYYIVHHAPLIRQWLAKLHDESLNAAIEGDPDPGSKAIDGGEGRRFFKDEKEAELLLVSALGTGAFKRKLIGFTEIDKIMKPGRKKSGFPEQYEGLQKLVDRKEAKAKLVPADHPAPAFVRALEDEFEDQDGDDLEDEFDDE